MDARDDRKTASVAAANLQTKPDAARITGFNQFREIMRSPRMRQANVQAGMENAVDPEMVSFFYLDGEEHRRRRPRSLTISPPRRSPSAITR